MPALCPSPGTAIPVLRTGPPPSPRNPWRSAGNALPSEDSRRPPLLFPPGYQLRAAAGFGSLPGMRLRTRALTHRQGSPPTNTPSPGARDGPGLSHHPAPPEEPCICRPAPPGRKQTGGCRPEPGGVDRHPSDAPRVPPEQRESWYLRSRMRSQPNGAARPLPARPRGASPCSGRRASPPGPASGSASPR